jgi:hypothetical protein
MPLALASTDRARSPQPGELIDAYLAHVVQTGRTADGTYRLAAERFFARWPDPMAWADQPLARRRQARAIIAKTEAS